MLHSLVGDHVLGTYVAAVRVSELFEALPAALVATMFPLLCAAASDKVKFDRYLDMTYRVLIVAGTSICVAISVGAGPIIRLLYGPAFQASAPLLVFLIWSEIAVFFSAVVYNALVALDLERHLILPTLLCAAINVGLNVLLIPKFGAMGSVWASVVAYSVAWMVVLLAFASTRPIIWRGLRAAIPAIVLACVVTWITTRFIPGEWLRISVAMILFIAGGVMLRLLRISDLDYARGVLSQVWVAIRPQKS